MVKKFTKTQVQSKFQKPAVMKKKMLKNGTGKKKKESTGKDLASMDLDAFINSVNDSDEEIQDSPPAEINSKSKEIRKNKKPVVEPEENEDSENEEDDEEEENEDDDNEDEEDNEGEVSKHKKTLSKLKDIDPEFYKFLSENDKDLLQFDTSDDEEDEDEEKGVHKLPDKLEVASDDSEFEDEETPSSGSNKVTQTLVDQWREQLKNEKSVRTIAEVVSAFRSAVQSLNTDEEKVTATKYKVDGNAGFNAIVRLCVSDLLPAVRRFLKAPENDKMFQPEKCKTWPKVKMHLKGYLLDLVKLLNSLSEPTLVSVLLKHVHQAVVFYSAFPKIARVLCKKLVNVWCSAEETVRVLAFLSLLRLARMIPDQLLEPIMKSMYLGYAKNSKFTSPTTWPLINFMRRSLVEIFALQDTVTYRHAFLYIRQLAIHLRNAVTLKKQDSIITVYNWQFVHCLHLWAALLGSLPNSQVLKSLLYPLVQIIVGTINLVATARYYPLRFHLSSILGKLSADTGVFIPVLPFLTEILQKHNFEKRPSKTSMKPLDFTCVLRVSQSQLAESGFRNAVVEQLYDKILEYLQSQSHVISFPELTLPLVLQIKAFLKKCDFPNYTKKMKQLLEKIQENSQFVENKRRQVSFDLSNTEAVRGFENQLKGSTPLAVFYASYKKMRDREVAIKLAKKVESKHEERIPVMKKPEKREVLDEKEFEGLFPSDEEDDVDDELRFLPKEERQSAKRKSENPQPEDVEEEEPVKKSKKEKTADKKDKKKKQKESAEEEKEDDAEMADEVADFQLSDFDHEDEDEEEVDEDEDEDGEDDEDAGEEDEDDDDEDFDDDEDDESD